MNVTPDRMQRPLPAPPRVRAMTPAEDRAAAKRAMERRGWRFHEYVCQKKQSRGKIRVRAQLHAYGLAAESGPFDDAGLALANVLRKAITLHAGLEG